MMPNNPWGGLNPQAMETMGPKPMDLLGAKLGGLGGLGGIDFGNVDMKSPLANFAMGMLQQEMGKNQQMPFPQHNMGMQPRQQQGALGPNLMQARPMGKMYG